MPTLLAVSWPGFQFPGSQCSFCQVQTSGSRHSYIACWVGSGPSDPHRHVHCIGNASIRRLANVDKMEHSTLLLQITDLPYSNGCIAMGTYNWNGCEGRASRPQVVPASAYRSKADTCPDRQAPPLAEIPNRAVAIVPVLIGNHPSVR